jgi:hypothetical protein
MQSNAFKKINKPISQLKTIEKNGVRENSKIISGLYIDFGYHNNSSKKQM